MSGRIDRHCFDDEFAALIPETEAIAMGLGKSDFDIVQFAEFYGECGVGSLIAQLQRLYGLDGCGGDALRRDFGGGRLGKRCKIALQCGHQTGAEWCFDCFFAPRLNLRKAHAEGRQDAGEGVDHDGAHAQRFGDAAGKLCTGATETL